MWNYFVTSTSCIQVFLRKLKNKGCYKRHFSNLNLQLIWKELFHTVWIELQLLIIMLFLLNLISYFFFSLCLQKLELLFLLLQIDVCIGLQTISVSYIFKKTVLIHDLDSFWPWTSTTLCKCHVSLSFQHFIIPLRYMSVEVDCPLMLTMYLWIGYIYRTTYMIHDDNMTLDTMWQDSWILLITSNLQLSL